MIYIVYYCCPAKLFALHLWHSDIYLESIISLSLEVSQLNIYRFHRRSATEQYQSASCPLKRCISRIKSIA